MLLFGKKLFLDIHYEDEDNSYLSPEKLFVLIDLDLQRAVVDRESNYDTEQLYYDYIKMVRSIQKQLINTKLSSRALFTKRHIFLNPIYKNYLIAVNIKLVIKTSNCL